MDRSWLLSKPPQRRERLINLAEFNTAKIRPELPQPMADDAIPSESPLPDVTAEPDGEPLP